MGNEVGVGHLKKGWCLMSVSNPLVRTCVRFNLSYGGLQRDGTREEKGAFPPPNALHPCRAVKLLGISAVKVDNVTTERIKISSGQSVRRICVAVIFLVLYF